MDCFRPSRQRRKLEIKIIARIREVDSGRAIVRASRIILEKVGRFVVTALNRRTVRLGVESESPDLPFLGVMVKEVT